jgi:hypothetical protein
MIISTPAISIYKIKRNLLRIVYDDDTSVSELSYYAREIRKHIYGTASDKAFEQGMFPLLSMLVIADNIVDRAEQQVDLSPKQSEFDTLQTKLNALINDFTEYLQDNELEERYMTDLGLEMNCDLNDVEPF